MIKFLRSIIAPISNKISNPSNQLIFPLVSMMPKSIDILSKLLSSNLISSIFFTNALCVLPPMP